MSRYHLHFPPAFHHPYVRRNLRNFIPLASSRRSSSARRPNPTASTKLSDSPGMSTIHIIYNLPSITRPTRFPQSTTPTFPPGFNATANIGAAPGASVSDHEMCDTGTSAVSDVTPMSERTSQMVTTMPLADTIKTCVSPTRGLRWPRNPCHLLPAAPARAPLQCTDALHFAPSSSPPSWPPCFDRYATRGRCHHRRLRRSLRSRIINLWHRSCAIGTAQSLIARENVTEQSVDCMMSERR